MPPWVASAPRLTSRFTARSCSQSLHVCRYRIPIPRPVIDLRVRSVSTQVSPTAINLRPDIPPRNKELHDALSALSSVAESYVNTDRLQLALSGVAAQESVTRVAVLALDKQLSAQRLARLLLADPLGNEEQWEKELEKASAATDKAILLKYGDPTDAQTPNPLYKTMAIPSRVLRNNNLEVLVSTLNTHIPQTAPATIDSSEDSILVPKLQSPSPRSLPLPFSVHKTLVVGDSLDSAVAFGRFTSDNAGELPAAVKLAIDLPPPPQDVGSASETRNLPINIDTGAQAIATFRQSIQNSVAYERGWYKSGLPAISHWLTQDLHPAQPIKPVLTSLITSVADSIEAVITNEDASRLQALAAIPSATSTSASITSHLESWAEKSHTELRDDLDDAFSTPNWHKLSWWKLLWRVDDISMITSEILERKWLTSAEKSSIYLAGRMNQAGFPDDILTPAIANKNPEITTEETAPTAENPRLDLLTRTADEAKGTWWEYIPNTRTGLINDTIPPLQALAQRLLLQTFSTTSLSSAASAILYVIVPTLSVFEASAIAALGLTISLRKMQKSWEGAKEMWQGAVREEGRRTLKETEELVRRIIKAKELQGLGVVQDGEDGVERRQIAREAVVNVRQALAKLEQGGHGKV